MGYICRSVQEPRLLALLNEHSSFSSSYLDPFIVHFYCFILIHSSSPVGVSLDHLLFQTKFVKHAFVLCDFFKFFMSQIIYILQLECPNVADNHKQALTLFTIWLLSKTMKEENTLPEPYWPPFRSYENTKLHLSNLSLSFDFLTRGDMSKQDNWRPSKSWTSQRSVNTTVFPRYRISLWNKTQSFRSRSPVLNAYLNFILIQKLIYMVVCNLIYMFWSQEKIDFLRNDPWLFTAQTP